MELSPSSPVLRFYTAEEVRGLELIQQARDHAIENTESTEWPAAICHRSKRIGVPLIDAE